MRYDLHSHPSSSHQQILHLVRADGRGPILDVGCAQGSLGQQLVRGHRSTGGDGPVLDGIEPHVGWAAEARPWYRTVWAANVEDVPLPVGEYAIVVCADVLEHLPDPVAVLGELRRAARPDARFIISLPNVAHVSARLMLLMGRWPRMERGIFDRTHLHFYDRDTAGAMLRDAGLHVVTQRTTPVPLEQVWSSERARRLLSVPMWIQRALLRVLPRLFAFQWILVAEADQDAPPRATSGQEEAATARGSAASDPDAAR